MSKSDRSPSSPPDPEGAAASPRGGAEKLDVFSPPPETELHLDSAPESRAGTAVAAPVSSSPEAVPIGDAAPSEPSTLTVEQQIEVTHEAAKLQQLGEYLSDNLPPMLVAEDVGDLLRTAPKLAADAVITWCHKQLDSNWNVPLPEYFYHALKKLQNLEELQLLSDLDEPLQFISSVMIDLCSPEERESFRKSLELLYVAEASLERVDVLHVAERAPAPQEPVERRPQNLRSMPGGTSNTRVRHQLSTKEGRFASLLERYEAQMPVVGDEAPAGGGVAEDRTHAGELLAAALESSRTSEELAKRMERLERLGLKLQSSGLLRLLSEQLPNWTLVGSGNQAPSSQLTAMQRLAGMAKDRTERSGNLEEILQVGVQQANEGQLGRAATLFSLANRLLAHDDVTDVDKSRFVSIAQGNLDLTALLGYADEEQNALLVRETLRFFPDYRIPALLAALAREQDRQERRKLLALLKVYGEEARSEVSRLLVGWCSRPEKPPWYIVRNLILLLRQMPHGPEQELDARELSAVAQCAGLDQPAQLIREAVGYLGAHIDNGRAQAVLIERLSSLAGMYASPDKSAAVKAQIEQIMSLVVRSLLRSSQGRAREAAVTFLLRGGEAAVPFRPLFSELSGSNLSDSPGLVDLMVGEIRSQLPSGNVLKRSVMSLRRERSSELLAQLLPALASTPVAVVTEALAAVAGNVRDSRIVRLANHIAKDLENLSPASGDIAATLSGDLDVFGLPVLLQSLAQKQTSGLLQLHDESERSRASLRLYRGDFVDCNSGSLTGTEAFHHMLQVPFTSRFALYQEEKPQEPAKKPQRLRPMLFEAMRRFDEYQRLKTVLPDGTWLKTAVRSWPSLPADEEPSVVAEQLWSRIESGTTPGRCDAGVSSEPYRIRKILVHWLDQGAIRATETQP